MELDEIYRHVSALSTAIPIVASSVDCTTTPSRPLGPACKLFSYRRRNYPGRNHHGEKRHVKIGPMKVDKMSISFDSGLGDQVRDAARKAGKGLSSWLAGAAAARLRAEALGEFLDAWEKKHGTLTAAELSQAERALGVGTPKKSRR
jgi:hypothetical protein